MGQQETPDKVEVLSVHIDLIAHQPTVDPDQIFAGIGDELSDMAEAGVQ